MVSPMVQSTVSIMNRTPNRKRLSVAPSGKSDSPGSVGFPDSLYIPRSRALRKNRPARQDSSAIPEGSTFSESLALGSTIGSPKPNDIIETVPVSEIRVVAPSEASVSRPVWSGTYNPTPQLPYLTVDKHMSTKLPNWRTPSFDENEGLLSRHNRQILLFCVGFVFPLGKSLMIISRLYSADKSQLGLRPHSYPCPNDRNGEEKRKETICRKTKPQSTSSTLSR